MTPRPEQLGDVISDACPGFASGDSTADGVIQLRMNNVTVDGIIDWSSVRRIPVDDQKRNKYSLRDGDIVFNNTNSPELVGKASVFTPLPEPVVFSNHFLRLRVDRRLAEPKFVAAWLNFLWLQREFERICTRWVNQAAVRTDDLLELPLHLPRLDEQQRMVRLFEQLQRLISTQRFAIELCESFLPAAFARQFHSHLNGGASRPLADAVRITGGGTPSRARPEYFMGNIPWLTPKDMHADYIWDTLEHVTADAIQKSAAKLIPAESILLVVKSKVLQHRLPVAIAKVAMCHGQDVKSMQCSSGFHPEYIRFVVKYHEARLLDQARGANTEGLNLAMLEDLPVPDVDYREQLRFASLVDAHERLAARWREELRQAKHLYGSLLQQSFGGGPRVTSTEPAAIAS